MQVADYNNRKHDYGQCIPGCTICDGLGFIVKDPSAHDRNNPDYGKLKMCPNKSGSEWDTTLGIDEEEAALLNYEHLQSTQAYTSTRPIIDRLLAAGHGWLYLWGDVGVGKTTMLKAAVLQWRYRYQGEAFYVNHGEMMDHLKGSFGKENKSGEFQARMDFYTGKQFLAIDEMGRDTNTDFAMNTVGKILDRRYTQSIMGKQITIFGSNFPPEQLDKYMTDRIRDTKHFVVKLPGKSARSLDIDRKSFPNWWKSDPITLETETEKQDDEQDITPYALY